MRREKGNLVGISSCGNRKYGVMGEIGRKASRLKVFVSGIENGPERRGGEEKGSKSIMPRSVQTV